MRSDGFICKKHHKSFLDRFRIQADSHRPAEGSETTRKIEWAEFPGTFTPTRAATCVDCALPIVNAVGSIWSVRLSDTVKGEHA